MPSADNSNALPKSVGFIGLGAMGKPMVLNLAKKLPSGSRIFIHDVVPDLVQELCNSLPDTIVSCASAREVVSKTVRWATCHLS